MELDPIVEQGKHYGLKRGNFTFPRFLRGHNDISHVFSGKKLVPNDNIWQICDITGSPLQRIVSTNQQRFEVLWIDGSFGTEEWPNLLLSCKIR